MKQNDSASPKFPPEIALCGVYCGACPSFKISCHGCSSNKSQTRKSKFSCKLRKCCNSEKSLACCFECDEFPCKEHRRKLIDSHPGDPRFTYRHELAENRNTFMEKGLEEYLQFQDERFRCSKCGGRVHWYHYKCSSCGAVSEN